MTAAKTAATSTYMSGFCGARAHERCRRDYRTAICTCPCHDEPPKLLGEIAAALTEIGTAAADEQLPGPAARLTRAAVALDVDHRPLPPAATAVLARILRAEGAWAADRGDTYPADRAPLLQLADLINGATA